MELGTNKLQASLYRYPLKGFRAVKGQKRGFLLTVSRSPPPLTAGQHYRAGCDGVK